MVVVGGIASPVITVDSSEQAPEVDAAADGTGGATAGAEGVSSGNGVGRLAPTPTITTVATVSAAAASMTQARRGRRTDGDAAVWESRARHQEQPPRAGVGAGR